MAFGLLFDDEEMNRTRHGVPLQPRCARLSVDGPIQGDALIPVLVVGEIEIVDQTIGSNFSWLRDLIILPNASNARVFSSFLFCIIFTIDRVPIYLL